MGSKRPMWFLLLFVLATGLPACQLGGSSAPSSDQAYPYPYPQSGQAVQPQPVDQKLIYPYPQPGQASPLPPAGQDLATPYPYPQPGQYPGPEVSSEVPWSRAEEMILAGEISKIMQTHDGVVYLTLTSGGIVKTKEPEIDAIIDLIQRCGEPCKNILIATE